MNQKCKEEKQQHVDKKYYNESATQVVTASTREMILEYNIYIIPEADLAEN